MLNVVCVKHGARYGADYVNILHDMVSRNLADGFEGRFICFTDDPTDINPFIEVRGLDRLAEGWWAKNWLFKDGHFPNGDRILYFDLDTIITGPLDEIAAYNGPFAILRDFYRPNGLQSSVMAWEANTMGHIWEEWRAAGRPILPGGDQEWIERQVKSADLWQDIFPDQFISYKVHGRQGVPKGARVVVFHGDPKPHNAGGWCEHLWKIGASNPQEFEFVVNVPDQVLRDNIESAKAIPDAMWLIPCKEHKRAALICAGGPSLADEIPSIMARNSSADIFACNGVPKFLVSHDIPVAFHVIADARPENERFAEGLSKNTICLYASQCDPAVHKAAKDSLLLWHAALDPVMDARESVSIGAGTTCGMKAAVLAWTLGYREIHFYGFDSCYRADEHHAYSQDLNDGERLFDVQLGNETFRAAPWMIQQAEDFKELAPTLVSYGCEIHVHGTGLIPSLAKKMAQANGGISHTPLIRAVEILKRLDGIKEPKVAEIGVFAGDLSQILLARRSDLHLTMIDAWGTNHSDRFMDSEDFHSTMTPEHHAWAMQIAKVSTSFAKDRATIIHALSEQAANVIPNESLDLVFIDADHSYEGCKADLEAYYPKVREGGILGGHDYANDEFKFGPMVKRAVDEFVAANALSLELGENYTWFARKPENRA